MIERLKRYLDEEFNKVELTKEMTEFKDELLANLVDQYEACINEGYTEEKAYSEAIKTIGNLSEVIGSKQTQIAFESVEKKPLEQLLYHNQPTEQLVYDKAINTFNLQTLIALSLLLFSDILFFILAYSLYKAPHRALFGLLGQITFLLGAIILYAYGHHRFNFMNEKIDQAFSNPTLRAKGDQKLKKHLTVFLAVSILSLCLTLPYVVITPLVLKDTMVANAILSFASYFKFLPLFLTFGCGVFLLLLYPINSYYEKQRGLTNQFKKTQKYSVYFIGIFLSILFLFIDPLPAFLFNILLIALGTAFILDYYLNHLKGNSKPWIKQGIFLLILTAIGMILVPYMSSFDLTQIQMTVMFSLMALWFLLFILYWVFFFIKSYDLHLNLLYLSLNTLIISSFYFIYLHSAQYRYGQFPTGESYISGWGFTSKLDTFAIHLFIMNLFLLITTSVVILIRKRKQLFDFILPWSNSLLFMLFVYIFFRSLEVIDHYSEYYDARIKIEVIYSTLPIVAFSICYWLISFIFMYIRDRRKSKSHL